MRIKAIAIFCFLLLISCQLVAKGNKKFYVADRKLGCAGNFECLQIREKNSDAWKVYADTIAGFNYEEGYEYRIEVEALQTTEKLSGLYDEKYKLLKVLSKKKTGYKPLAKFDNRNLILVSMYDTKNTLSMSDSTIRIKLNIEAGKMNMKGVCNTFRGNLKMAANQITISDISGTKMMCKGSKVEQVVTQMLHDSNSYKLEGNQLVLLSPEGASLIFRIGAD